jgi:hypothetical protein
MKIDVRFLNRLRMDYLGGDPALWELATPFYTSINGEEHIVEQGYITDLGSVPRLPLAYAMAGNRCPRACVLHDDLYNSGIFSREFSDEVFYHALIVEFNEIIDAHIAAGVSGLKLAALKQKYSVIAKMMYAGVRVGGASHFKHVSKVKAPAISLIPGH